MKPDLREQMGSSIREQHGMEGRLSETPDKCIIPKYIDTEEAIEQNREEAFPSQ